MIEEEEQEQFHLLVTRAKEYDLHEGQVSASTPKPKLLKRNATFVKCREYVNLTNTIISIHCLKSTSNLLVVIAGHRLSNLQNLNIFIHKCG